MMLEHLKRTWRWASVIAVVMAAIPSAALAGPPSVTGTANGTNVYGIASCSPMFVGDPPSTITPSCGLPPGYEQPILPISAAAPVTFTAEYPVTFGKAVLVGPGPSQLATLDLTVDGPNVASAVMPAPLPEEAQVLVVDLKWQHESNGELMYGTESYSFTLKRPPSPQPVEPPQPPPPPAVPAPPPSPPPPPATAFPKVARISETTLKHRGVAVELTSRFAARVTATLRTKRTNPRPRSASGLPRVLGRSTRRLTRPGTLSVWIPYTARARRVLSQRPSVRASLEIKVRPLPSGKPIVLRRAMRL
jgi:hypothetical protein